MLFVDDAQWADVGSLELVLGGQHVGGDGGGGVGDDLGGDEQVERAECRLEGVEVGEGRQDAPAQVEEGAHVAGANLVREDCARPLPEECLRVGPGAGAWPEHGLGREDGQLEGVELHVEAGMEPDASRAIHGAGHDHQHP